MDSRETTQTKEGGGKKVVGTRRLREPLPKPKATRIFTVANQPTTQALINETSRRIAAIRVSSEGQEGLSAFLQKRTPAWQLNDRANDAATDSKGQA